MGLHVTSVAQITSSAPHLQGIDYFVYVLDYYNIGLEVMDALVAELPNLERHFAELGNALIVSSVRNIDFANEVLSWHNCFGKDASEVCPALLICSLPPQYFLDREREEQDQAPWILLQLGELCNSTEGLKKLLQQVARDISQGKPLTDFEAVAVLEHQNRPIISGKLKYMGVELDHKALFEKVRGTFKSQWNRAVVRKS
ncbi:hypothetical protein [uncultured Roseibium sp.]|uniref:hypothetical protein n=1 Tax=uncultured Roseibium sp. TaxID=1936171 RepID=UPI0032172B8E